eukprot:3124925-Amphidinium_carterae.1
MASVETGGPTPAAVQSVRQTQDATMNVCQVHASLLSLSTCMSRRLTLATMVEKLIHETP